MCDHDTSILEKTTAPLAAHSAETRGSRRYRLWELDAKTHCPLIGVCLPLSLLRRLMHKALGPQPLADDYDFHVIAVAESGRRGKIAELLQRELDRRYATTLRRFAQAKTRAALLALWQEALQGSTVAEALWATLSHPRCDASLQDGVCRDIHMLQHQVGACNRADLQQLEHLHDAHQSARRELAAIHQRYEQTLQQRLAENRRLETELMRARAQLLARDTSLAALREEMAQLQEQIPDLPARQDLLRRLELQRHRIHELERQRAAWSRAASAEPEAKAAPAPDAPAPARPPAPARLADKAVLCVGGRTASVPLYRQIVEDTGGKFLHHDGGAEHSTAQLDASLAAADLVICQTGCVSHGAYWRVKDHCKRTGKRCIFVDKPSGSSLVRSLTAPAAEVDEPG